MPYNRFRTLGHSVKTTVLSIVLTTRSQWALSIIAHTRALHEYARKYAIHTYKDINAYMTEMFLLLKYTWIG